MPALSSDSQPAPDLTTHLGQRLTLPTPVIAASGTFGYGDELADMMDAGLLGALITPTLTRNTRIGNPPPRTSEASAGLLHAVGLPNPGMETFVRDFTPQLRRLTCPLIVNILGETPEEWSELACAVGDLNLVTALELNLNPLMWQIAERSQEEPPTEAEMLTHIATAVDAVKRAIADIPIIAKLPCTGLDTGRAARIAMQAGADVISVAPAFPGIAVRPANRAFRFPGVVGGLSGPCIKPMALYHVWRIAQACGAPVLGAGGIMTGDDALEFLCAGAAAVAVGTATLVSPTAISRITSDISTYMQHNKLNSVSDLIGVV